MFTEMKTTITKTNNNTIKTITMENSMVLLTAAVIIIMEADRKIKKVINMIKARIIMMTIMDLKMSQHSIILSTKINSSIDKNKSNNKTQRIINNNNRVINKKATKNSKIKIYRWIIRPIVLAANKNINIVKSSSSSNNSNNHITKILIIISNTKSITINLLSSLKFSAGNKKIKKIIIKVIIQVHTHNKIIILKISINNTKISNMIAIIVTIKVNRIIIVFLMMIALVQHKIIKQVKNIKRSKNNQNNNNN